MRIENDSTFQVEILCDTIHCESFLAIELSDLELDETIREQIKKYLIKKDTWTIIDDRILCPQCKTKVSKI